MHKFWPSSPLEMHTACIALIEHFLGIVLIVQSPLLSKLEKQDCTSALPFYCSSLQFAAW